MGRRARVTPIRSHPMLLRPASRRSPRLPDTCEGDETAEHGKRSSRPSRNATGFGPSSGKVALFQSSPPSGRAPVLPSTCWKACGGGGHRDWPGTARQPARGLPGDGAGLRRGLSAALEAHRARERPVQLSAMGCDRTSETRHAAGRAVVAMENPRACRDRQGGRCARTHPPAIAQRNGPHRALPGAPAALSPDKPHGHKQSFDDAQNRGRLRTSGACFELRGEMVSHNALGSC